MEIFAMRLNHVWSLVVWEYGVGKSRVGMVGSVVSIESVVVVVRLKVETDDSDACFIYDRPRKEREFLLNKIIGINIKVAQILV